MSSPVKDITYLTGSVYALADYPGGEMLNTLGTPLGLALARLPEALWLPVKMVDLQSQAEFLGDPESYADGTPLSLITQTVFFRSNGNRPLRGQLWPLTR